MKRIFLSLVLLITVQLTFAQTKTLEIKSEVTLNNPPTCYKMWGMIARNRSGQEEEDTPPLDMIKKQFLDTLALVGLDKNKLTFDDLAYRTAGYSGQGTMIQFTTKDIKEIEKFSALTFKPLNMFYTEYVHELNSEERIALMKKNLEAAKKHADELARAQQKKVGDIIKVTDENSFPLKAIMEHDGIKPLTYKLTVLFEIL